MSKYLVLLALLSVGAFAVFAGASASLEPGMKAPSFTLKDADGKEHSLDQYLKSKYVVVMFISTQCPVSKAYDQRMAALYADYAPKDIAFLGINSNRQEDVGEIKDHAAKNGLKFAVLKDVGNVVADSYGAQVTPEVYIVDAGGVLRYHGRIDDSKDTDEISSQDIRASLDALLAGKEPPRTETKAFGCTIKRIKKEN